MRDLEHQHAVALMNWWALSWARLGSPHQSCLFAIPNGGQRHIAVAVRMQLEGVRPGIPDYLLSIPADGCHGMYIELKTNKGRVSDNQIEMIRVFESLGYRTFVARGWELAAQQIEFYLGKIEVKK